jgi:major membrane immunogen (membrane-anchored lipoprotein)
MKELEGSLVSTQDAAAVNTVSGATGTSADFKALAEIALKGAK